MKAIVCVDKNWGIGKDNGLLFRLPADMAFFKENTLGKVVVMGANTLNSFPNSKPLKDRVNIVLSSKMPYRDDCVIVRDLKELSKELKKYDSENVMVIGGGSVYKALLDNCSEILVTKANADGSADTFFDNLDNKDNFELVYQSEVEQTNGIDIVFTTYKNNNVIEF